MIHVVWAFTVRAASRAPFEQAYGPRGPWARLFEGFAGYRGTSLLRDNANSLRYLTVDRWDSLALRAAMLAAAREEYASLDRECAGFMESEAEIGVFDDSLSVAPGSL